MSTISHESSGILGASALKLFGLLESYDDFNDMVIIGAAKRMGMGVISFDRKMREKVGK